MGIVKIANHYLANEHFHDDRQQHKRFIELDH